MVSNPIEEDPENLGCEVHFEEKLSDEEEAEFKRRVTNQIGTFLKMSDIPFIVQIEEK